MRSALILAKLNVLWTLWTMAKGSETGGFLFVAPKTLLAGNNDNSMCIFFENKTNIDEIEVKILRQKEDIELVSKLEKITEIDGVTIEKMRKVTVAGEKCFKMAIPTTKMKNGRLQLIIRLKTDGNFNINYIEQISIRPNPDVTFIRTDKPVYTGGQLLQFRIFNLKSDLKAATEPIDEIWIENPNRIRLMQWLNEFSPHGILNKTYRLSDRPMPGVWTIKLKKGNGQTIKQTFLVDNYVLPRFSVAIKSQKYIETSGNISVCAKYLFGEPVLGEVVLQYFIKCSFSYYCQENESLVKRNFRLGEDGCIHHEIPLKNVPNFARFMIVNATVVEDGTGKKADASAKLEIRNSRIKHSPEFTKETKKRKFKPGLPFKGEIFFQSQNREQRVVVCLEVSEYKSCRQLILNTNQIEFLLLPIPITNENNFKASLEVRLSEEGSTTEHHPTRFSLVPWYSPSGSYLSLEKTSSGPLKCGEDEKFKILFSISDPNIKFHYMVKARGVILENGILDGSLAKPFEYDENTNVINHGDVSNVRLMEFNLTVTCSWSPKAHLLLHYIRHDKEIIADTLALTVEKCLPNMVKTKWGESITSPGSTNMLQIETSPHSLCALTITDKSLHMISPTKYFTLEKILEKFEVNSTGVSYPSSGHCKKKKDTNSNYPNEEEADDLLSPREMDSRFVDSLNAFIDFGALVLTDLELETRPCNENGRLPDAIMRNSRPDMSGKDIENLLVFDAEDSSDIDVSNFYDSYSDGEYRTYFPETWIWDLVPINDSGVVNFTFDVPDTITEWATETICLSDENGLGMAQNSKFVTYKPFFLDFFVPHFLKRKEIFHLQVSVFNYESSALPVKITYNPSTSFISRSEEVVSYCVRSKSKILHRFVLEAFAVGEAEISISAEIDSSFPGNCGNIISDKRDVVVKKLKINHEGLLKEDITSGFICANSSSFDHQINWNIKVPPEIIESSISLKALVSGDILGPTLKNIEHLITMPTGCGEQNMVLIVPNILLLDYLLLTKFNDVELIERALRNLDLGYQKQLNYKRRDNSYSAFGEEDGRGSIWLTAFVVRYMSQAKKYIYVDSKDLNSSVSWIMRQQLENGCFPMIGKVYHRNFQDKFLEEDSLKILTAYILIALIESGVPTDNAVIKNAIYCLKPTRDSLGLYGDLLSAYAFISAGEFRDAQALMLELMKEAKRSYGMLWWESGESVESSIEMTAYGILTFVKLGSPHFMAAASDALRWLIQHQNQNGGFISTQDTVVALEALSKFSATLPPAIENDRLYVTAKTSEKSHNFSITKENKMLLQKFNLPSFTTNIHFEVNGRGCALVQTHLQYNVRKGNPNDNLKIQLRIHSVSDTDSNSIARFHVCARYDSPEGKIGMAVLEIYMVSGYYPDRASLYDIQRSRKGVRRWEEYEERVVFYFEDLKKRKLCLKFLMVREVCVENTAPALIKLYDYYDTQRQTTLKYNLNPNCQNATLSNSLDSLDHGKKNESKRDLRDNTLRDDYKSTNLNDNFIDVGQDLETPSGLEGVMPVYVLPPRQDKGRKCPHCLDSIPKFFPQLYCSSTAAFKVEVLSLKTLKFQLDVSSRKNITEISKTVPFAIGKDCVCPHLESVNTQALLMVSPPKEFDIKTIEEIMADDYLQFYPWENSANSMPDYLTEAIKKCQKLLNQF